ncbi:hypothetical protein NDU88_003836 [Pleurodeles waltl]|uniref:Uncharacterized protein n=1 Tax=Pleurodeles waltl TaxID=8319 RepID=A0AAV7T635_PLEWA|nr:hypothetical protein NDU88_003836 [Pleurodeles waltl]
MPRDRGDATGSGHCLSASPQAWRLVRRCRCPPEVLSDLAGGGHCGRARSRAERGPEAATSGDPRDHRSTVGAGRRLLPRSQVRQLALRCWCAAEEPSGAAGGDAAAGPGRGLCAVRRRRCRGIPMAVEAQSVLGVARCPGGGAQT